EGLMDGGGYVLWLQDACGPLGDRANGVHLIVHFMQHAPVNANEITLNLSRNNQDWRRGSVGGANACRGILQAGAGYHECRADAAPSTGVSVRHVARRLLMAGGDKSDAGFIVEAIQQVIELHARQAKYDAYTFAVERLCECLTTGHLRHIFLSPSTKLPYAVHGIRGVGH